MVVETAERSVAPVQWRLLGAFGVVGAALPAYVGVRFGAQQAVLLALGTGLGVALFHSRFGFSSAWRQLVAVGQAAGPRAHAVLLGTTATLFALVLGGILMGVGARLAGGCTIGAYLAGIASGSLSGWVRGAVALAGTWVGLRGRRLFGLANPTPQAAVC
ncbi:MAG: hypothetical protein BGP03_14565 [Pseudonocardia sp. 73-21]|nr:MAG: hypothetical protein BGP03_14565 [Pseudonocardia sp. 73-21]